MCDRIGKAAIEQAQPPGRKPRRDRHAVSAVSIEEQRPRSVPGEAPGIDDRHRSEEHTSELPSLMRISYAVFCLTKKKLTPTPRRPHVPTTTLDQSGTTQAASRQHIDHNPSTP